MNIFDEVSQLGNLETIARAIIDFVTVRSANSKFIKTTSGEWTLEPDNWIALKFTYRRKKVIHVSLGVYTSTIDLAGERAGIEIKKGRYPSWSKITISSRSELPDALDILGVAYRKSDNTHRQWYGHPRKNIDLSHAKYIENA